MEDNSNLLNKTIAVGLISGVIICSCKEAEQHSLEIFYQDQVSTYQAASGYTGTAIGENWILEKFQL